LAHKEEIHHLIMVKKNPAIMALTETRLTPDIDDFEVNVPGYSMVRCDSVSRKTGGSMIYVRNDIRYETLLTEKMEPNCWATAIEIKEKWYKGIVMVVYHSPSASDAVFISFLMDIVEDLVTKSDCIVIGDFNIDFMTNSFYAKKLRTTMSAMGMKQYVEEPTRTTRDSRSIIDLVFANNEIKVNVMHEPMITDHSCLKIEHKGRKANRDRKYIARNYSDFEADQLLKYYRLDWNAIVA